MSLDHVQAADLQVFAESWLARRTRLGPVSRRSLATLAVRLLERIGSGASVIGIAGAPGSGKSTLAGLLVSCLERTGTPSCHLSLDDYYLDRSQREALARSVHPLFRFRGVPGTHELDRLLTDLDRIRAGDTDGLRIPIFDKSRDDRAPAASWRTLDQAPRITFLEGWFIGAGPPSESSMARPINDLERSQDPDAIWRDEMQLAWRRYARELGRRLDQLWYIRVPDWESVVDWRWQQEQELAKRNFASRKDVENFLRLFERIVCHMQSSHSDWADLTLYAGHEHDITLRGNTA